jgi:formylglycine-generating enzyme required for sulfatase activity
MGDPGSGCILGDILSVGSRSSVGDGRWRHADLAGSMLEWTLDVYMTDYTTPCLNCAQLNAGASRVVRGGDWKNPAAEATTLARTGAIAIQGTETIGIRCARTVL